MDIETLPYDGKLKYLGQTISFHDPMGTEIHQRTKVAWAAFKFGIAFIAMVGHATASFMLLIRCWKAVKAYWRVLPFYPDCNFLLSMKVLSAKEVFSTLMLATAGIFDTVLATTAVAALFVGIFGGIF